MKRIFLSLLMTAFAAQAAFAVTPLEQVKIDQLHKSGLELLNQWKYKQAIQTYREIIALNPGDKTAARYLALSQEQMAEPFCKQASSAYLDGNYKKAILLWEEILKINPADQRIGKLIAMTREVMVLKAMETQYTLVERLFREKNYDLAIVELDKLLAARPDDARAQEMLVAAREAAREEEIKRHYERGAEFAQDGQFEYAIHEWRRILELDPKQESAMRLIAETGRKKLLAEYEEASRLFNTGNYAAARDLYTKILTENPTDLEVEKAIAKLDKILIIAQMIDDEGTPWEMIRKAVSNHLAPNGNIRAAIVAARYAEQLEPDSGRIRSIREFIEKEHFAVVRGMEPPSKSTSVIDQYLAAALSHIYEGRFDLAIEECDLVLILEPKNVLALKRLGSAYFAIGKRSKASEAWQRALALAPNDSELKQFIRKAR